MVRREGRDNASVQCPDGYQVVGGGCTFIEGTEFTLRESYPTSRNTWECVFQLDKVLWRRQSGVSAK